MAGEGEKTTSIRRRLTTSIKRVMSYTSGKSQKSGSSITATYDPSPTVPSSSAAAPIAPTVAIVSTLSLTSVSSRPGPSQPLQKPAHKSYRPPKHPSTPPPPMTAAERAQALFKRHGLDVKPSDLPLSNTPQAERVQKDIRMRVHRTCHKCDTSYGPDKTCQQCGHKRCKRCPRHPLKKSKDKGKEKLTAKGAPGYKKRRGDYMYGITIPGKRGGQDLVHKEVRQRVHRKCHRCEADFAGEKLCRNCKHQRCKKCPRLPYSKNHSAGYYKKFDQSDSEADYPAPPRRTYKKPRRRIHWTCNKCSTTFIEKTRICGGCGSNRDDTGLRDPPKKPKFKPTDVDVQRLNDRLKQTSLSAAS
ncbi:hypothetical protein K440DRAFT_563672 [Wilcoxina mikolae CBS 423.85]|nr:hypothetical protein K440DRAFT_563672 [Wilcoxina mikolae CBS 423.85]